MGRRIGFYKIRGEIGCGNFSHVKLGIHALTKGKKMREDRFRLTVAAVKREGIRNQTATRLFGSRVVSTRGLLRESSGS